ncbi:hypothetical protein [Streptosporangium amethystogenes]|uniref:hypothetical protein n=1 Tax=Streptosporangium amethystogenes TaxID=2002 RepID=UPI000AEE9CF6|nr:hypothetical protein [Streptosporangium amethystogenes]
MAHATPPVPARTGGRISGVCTLDFGHPHCSPGPVYVDGIEVLPQSCYCDCHSKPKKVRR